MKTYVDKNGLELEAGHIVRYTIERSNDKYYHSIDEVVQIAKGLALVERVGGYPNWELRSSTWTPTLLEYYLPWNGGEFEGPRIRFAEVIGNVQDNPELISIDFARSAFG